MRLRPGSLIVLEGLDATGKSTQAAMLAEQFPQDLSIHSPSGNSRVGAAIYRLTEAQDDLNPLARQLLHLASHAEMYDHDILPTLRDNRGVFLDRNWWSTVAYGYSDDELRGYLTYEELRHLAQLPTHGTNAAYTFCFMHPYAEDRHNTPGLMKQYHRLLGLASSTRCTVFTVPQAPLEVNSRIISQLAMSGLIQ